MRIARRPRSLPRRRPRLPRRRQAQRALLLRREDPMRPSANHLITLALALALGACSTAPSQPQAQPTAKAAKAAKPVPAPRVDVKQDEGGFTIVEEVRVGNDIHADYDNAMRFFEQKQYEQGIASLVKVTEA